MNTPKWISKGLNLPALGRSRLHWVDYLKGIAIILVVYRHILIGMGRTNVFEIPAYLFKANNIFYSFRMPLFFVLSGIFLARSLAKRGPWSLALQKFETLFYPYLIWATIQTTIQIVMTHYHLTNSDRTWRDLLYILYQPKALDQFWYLPALFNTTIIYIFTKSRLKFSIYAQLALGLALYFTAPYVNRYSMLSDWMEFYFFFALGDALSKVFFQQSLQKLLKNPWSLVALTPLFVTSQVYYLGHSVNDLEFLCIALTGCATMFLVAFLLERFNAMNWLRVLGYHSLYIYVLHVLVAAVVRIVMTNVLHIHQVHVVLLTGIAFGVLIPIFFYNYLVQDGPLWWLFYFRRSSMEDKEKEKPRPASPGQETPIFPPGLSNVPAK